MICKRTDINIIRLKTDINHRYSIFSLPNEPHNTRPIFLCFTTFKRNLYLLALFTRHLGTNNEWSFSVVEKKQSGSLIESDEFSSGR